MPSLVKSMNAGTWIVMYEGLAATLRASLGSLNQLFKMLWFLLAPNMVAISKMSTPMRQNSHNSRLNFRKVSNFTSHDILKT